MTRFSLLQRFGRVLLIFLIVMVPYGVSAASGSNSLTVVVKDEHTQANPGRALVYVDGGYRGEIAAGDSGSGLVLQGISTGTHVLRVTGPGYKEANMRFRYPEQSRLEVSLAKESLVYLGEGSPTPGALTVVFYPSSTSYNCTGRTKVSAPEYISNETKFRMDVQNVIRLTYLELGNATSAADPLPLNYRERFNFYSYYDPAAPADAFAGCAGTLPDQYWDEVTFSDVTVILYPTYYGTYSDAACEPTGCTQDTGTAHNVMKVPADQPVLLKHETGHAVYGLIDTYCGDTYYYQNDPYPNVWESLESCTADARLHNRDAGRCRQIQKAAPASVACVRDYWQWDPAPDIMANGYSGKFGAAATQRINYILSKVKV